MTKTRSTKRALFLSAMSLLLCAAMLIGTTYAWFTESVSSVNNVITGGNLDVELYWTTTPADDTSWKAVDADTNVFKEDTLWEPGHTEVVYLKVVNEGTLSLKYQLGVNVVSEKAGTNVANEQFLLSNYIKYAVLGEVEEFDTRTEAMDYIAENPVAASGFLSEAYLSYDRLLNKGDAHYATIVVYMPETVGNEANYRVTDTTSVPEINLGLNMMASQYTNEQDSFGKDYDKDAEKWDGAVDTSWYDPEATVYELTTPNQLAGLAKLVDEGNSFEGKIVKLAADIDLESKIFDPIGSYRKDKPFKGTFDGQGHTIFNLSQNTWALDNGYYYGDLGLGLFGKVENATIKHLTMDGADISGESAIVGIVAGCAYGDCTFENITVSNSKGADYQYYAGGLVGWASGNHVYKNCNVEASTTIAAQWGDFDNSTGGVIGGAGGSATILMQNCNVACQIDAYNDVTSSYQWYAYRRCGMLIGNTGKTVDVDGTTYAAAPQLTCENVTVTYGDWANYTYCEFAGTNWPYVRVQAGVSNSAYSNPRYGHPTDANGKQVVDDNHDHNDGEDHLMLCAFDQLYGGGQGVYGDATHDGVTVIYPASTSGALIDAMENGKNVKLTDNVNIPADKVGSNGYGATGINVLNGQTFDGNDKTFGVDAWGTWDSAINTTGGIIKNVTINKGMRGIFVNHNSSESSKVILENVTVDGTVYTISCDQGTNQGLKATDCTFNGWTSYAATIGAVEFFNCSFGEGQGYKYCRPYAQTSFVGCDFAEGYVIDARAAVTFENCTFNGQPLTAENLSTLVTGNIANATVIG